MFDDVFDFNNFYYGFGLILLGLINKMLIL